MSRRKYCPNCGANVEPEGKYCIVCGSQLTDLPSGAVEEVPEFQSKPGKKVYCRFCGVRLRRGAICTCDEGIAWAKRIARAEEEAACKKAEEEEAARRKAEEEAARKKAEEEEAARKKAEEEETARRRAEEEAARRRAEEEAARKKAEEEETARRKAEEEAARKKAEEEEAARKKAEEAARRKAEEEAARKKAEEEEAARRRAEEEAVRKKAEEEEAARKKAEEEEAARRRAEEEAARRKAEEEAARRRAEKEAARKKEEAEAKKRQEEAHAKAVRSVDERWEAAEKTEKKRRGGKRVRRFIFLAILVGACVYFYRIGELDSYLVRFGLTRFTSSNKPGSNSTGVSGNDAIKIFGNEGAVQMDNQAQMGIETGDAGDQNAADVPQADEKTNEDIVAFDAAGTDLSNYHAVPMTASATASCTEYPPANIVDGNTATVWEENVDGFGSGIVSITLVPGESEEVRYLTFKLGRWNTDDPADTDGYQRNSRPMNLSLQINENEPKTVFFADEKKEWMIDLVAPVEVSRINVTLGEGYKGTSYNDVAITEITAYAGNAASPQAEAAAVSTDVQVVAEAPEKTAAEKDYQYISFIASDTDEITWEQAEAECETMGGHLASIRSMDDFNEIVDTMPVSADSSVVYHMYLGGIRDTNPNNPAFPTPYYWYDGGSEDKLDNYDLDSLWLTVDGVKEPTFHEVIHGEILAQTVIMMFNYEGEWVLDDVESDYASVVKGFAGHSSYKIGYIMEKEIEN